MSEAFGATIPFHKMQGCGNDFVAIDNRDQKIPAQDMSEWAVKICARAFGVYADGVFFIENVDDPNLAYKWHFFNSDGSRAEMCGNASRCVGKLANILGIAPEDHSFGTDAGPIKVHVITTGDDAGEIKVQLTKPQDLKLNVSLDVDGVAFDVHFVNTGVPHVVVLVKDVAALDVATIGLAIRYHENFAPAGTNVNFAQVVDPETVLVRTLERGVEAETYACGTGVAAVQLICNSLGLTGPTSKLTTSGGETLTVYIEDGNLYLQGAAECTFFGQICLDPMGLKL